MRKKTATKRKTTAKKKNCIPKGYKIVRKRGKSSNTRYRGKMPGSRPGIYIYEIKDR